MTYTHPLLEQIEEYLAAHNMGASYFGKKATGNSELVARLREGGDITGKTAQRVREFLELSAL